MSSLRCISTGSASDTSPADDTLNLGNGFDPAALGATPDAQGNYVGKPAFVSPRDPRPGSDGPADLFIDANFDHIAVELERQRARLVFRPSMFWGGQLLQHWARISERRQRGIPACCDGPQRDPRRSDR